MLSIKQLSFGYMRDLILKDISIDIPNHNQIIALLGPNGAGKTTLLNVIANYYQKYKGELSKKDFSAFLLPDISYIPQDMTISSCLSDFEHLYKKFNRKRAEEMLRYLKLDFNKKVSAYSKGMKEQLHLVFALAQDVDYYLFDEVIMINNGEIILYQETQSLIEGYSDMNLDQIYKEVNRDIRT